MTAGAHDRLYVITGGGGAVGSGVAAELCRRGARVVLCGRTVDTLNRARDAIESELGPGRAGALRCDVRDVDAVTGMIDAVEQRVGAIDGLVHAAALVAPPAPAELTTPETFSDTTQVALQGGYTCANALGRHWLGQGRGGALVTVVGDRPGDHGAPAAAARGGLLALTTALGAEWAERGIRVNAVTAGDRATPATIASAVAYLLSDDAAPVTGTCLAL